MATATVAADPRSIDGWRVLGRAANALKQFDVAERAFDEATKIASPQSPGRVRDLLARAEPLICLGRPADAVICIREAVNSGLTTSADLFQAALAFSHLGLQTEALPLAEGAIALDPNCADAWSLIGNARQFLGEVNAAETAFRNVIALSRERAASAYHSLAHLRKWDKDNHIRAMEAFQCRNSAEASRIGYALFKEYDDMGDVERAWDCLGHAARIGRAMESWSDLSERRTFAAWKKAFPFPLSAAGDARLRNGPKRIFIVGLPRSGTTLVERILVSHDQVQTIGEVNTLAIATRRIASPQADGIISPQIVAASQTIDPLAIADEYTANTNYLCDGSAYTIDKRPDNFQYAGLIAQVFPDAIVVVLDRNPMDALFGAYKRSFAPGAHGWSYTMDDLADHYHNFRGLIRHWEGVMGNSLVPLSLESLIADPEGETRRLLARCGLAFQERCLRPHESSGSVTTASALQVRQPINAHGVGAWKRYADQLEPLRRRLSSFGYAV